MFGSGAWGVTPWGSGSPVSAPPAPTMTLVSVATVQENVVRATFDNPVNFTGVLDPKDAASPSNYVVSIVSGIGLDGSPVWPVSVVQALVVPGDLASVDIMLDRPMTPYPAQYSLVAANVWDVTKTRLLVPAAMVFYGVHQNIVPATSLAQPQAIDIANPQTLGAMGSLSNPNDPRNLGSIPVDSTGDYAVDQGVVSLKKRLLRRLFSKRGGFAHLPEYGVDAASYGKTLNNTSNRSRLSADSEQQLGSEPEVAQISVRAIPQSAPGLIYLNVLVKTKQGQGMKLQVPVS